MGVCPLSCTCSLFCTTPSFIDNVLLSYLMRSEKTAARVDNESPCNEVPNRRNNYRRSWICKYSIRRRPLCRYSSRADYGHGEFLCASIRILKFQTEVLSVISNLFLNTIVTSFLTTHILEHSTDTLQSPYCSIRIPYNVIILNVDENC